MSRDAVLLVALVAMLLNRAAVRAAPDVPLPPGTYRLEMRVGAHTAMPVLGETDTATVSISRVQIEADGDGLRQTHRVCATRFESGIPLVRVSMPERFIAALIEHSYPLRVDWTGAEWTYHADLGVERVGYQPASADAPLPVDAQDPSVVDSDGDGHPGATLQLSIAHLASGELYVVQRGQSVLEGRVVAVGQVEGRIDVRLFEQGLLGARPGFLKRSPQIALDPARCTFRLVRVADDVGCGTIAEAAYDPGPPADASRVADNAERRR